MNTWIVIVAVGLGSYLFRLSMIILTGRITMPPYLERASGLVVPAAFAALAAAGVAAAVALAALSAPLQLGLALAIAAGVTAGLTGQPDGPAHSPHPLQRTAEVRR